MAPGSVAGAVLRSARKSAALSRVQLAAAVAVSAAIVQAWEEGEAPLADLPAPRLALLEATLLDAGADPSLVADLAVAAWCDVVILAVASAEDPGCLLADPLAQHDAFLELLAWAIADQPPARHRPYTTDRRLLPTVDLGLVAGVVQAIDTGLRHRAIARANSGHSR